MSVFRQNCSGCRFKIGTMQPIPNNYLKAFFSRDERFDGLFFTGVKTTGVYCRPICSARKPKQENCIMFDSAAQAEQSGFRPCLRCRPELAPLPSFQSSEQDNAQRIIAFVQMNLSYGKDCLTATQSNLGIGERQLRRMTAELFGVTPTQLIQTYRLLLAKQLLTDTQLPITDVALSSGFDSIRRFNEVFKSNYKLTPSQLRRETVYHGKKSQTVKLNVSYRRPFLWSRLLNFLNSRTLKGVELIHGDSYFRTIEINNHRGIVKVTNNEKRSALELTISEELTPVISQVLVRIKHLFDVNAQPELIANHLNQKNLPGDFSKNSFGLRVPGAFNGFELTIRAVLGQQVTVKAARTLSGRFSEYFGDPIETDFEELNRMSPSPERIARATLDDICSLGIVSARANAIIEIAQRVLDQRLTLEPGGDPNLVIQQLLDIKGIGPWTSQYIAFRVLRWPDAFPKEDIGIRNALGRPSPKQALEISQSWSPWRSYAVLHLWDTLNDQ